MEDSRLTLVMLAGLPGAGKTTLAYALQKELGWRVIDKDKYRITLFKHIQDDELASREAYNYSFAQISRVLKDEQESAVFDTAAILSPIVDAVQEIIGGIEGVRLKVILCVIDREERDYRLLNRPAQYTRITVEPETIEDYLQLFDHLPPDKLILFTNIPPEECVNEAKKYLMD